MTPQQSKMARAALGLSLKDVAYATELSIRTVQLFEAEKRDLMHKNHQKLKQFYQAQKIAFIGDMAISTTEVGESTSDLSVSLFDDVFLRRVDNWRAAREDNPSRDTAIRYLCEIGLQAKTDERQKDS